MQFNTFFTAIVSYACIAGAIAAAAVVPASEATAPEAVTPADVSFSKQAGCGSQGPFGSATPSPYIVTQCASGYTYRCQAMDATGCHPGDVSYINTLEVYDPNFTRQITSGAHSNSVPFVCPYDGQARCQANLAYATNSSSYTLRVVY